jgi:hypothetical protein
MNYKLSWHSKEIAEQWPMGSVVLCRKPQPKPASSKYSYILSLCFMPESMSFDMGYEFMLIEEPKERKQTK